MRFAEALQYLDDHSNYERTGRVTSPSTDNIERLLDVLGNPERDYKVIHVTGTNGKGSTSQIITRLLEAHGLRVGTYSSPHLEGIRERIQIDATPVSEHDFADAVAAVADAEVIAGVRPTFFEIVTAAAFRCFSDHAVDVAVVEVGMLGRWDATNVVQSEVAVVTNVAYDHTEFAGPTLEDIAREKAGIVKDDCAVVIGETRPEIVTILAADARGIVRERERDFFVVDNHLALGGRSLHLRTARADYPDLFLPLHGRHQGDNASVALSAVEEFFGAPLPTDIVVEGLSRVAMPGRFEVVGHQPLVILDGAHNPAGADVCAEVFFSDFDPHGRRILVVGTLRSRDLDEMLSALRVDEFDEVVCCTAPSPRARPASDVAAVARALGCDHVAVVEDPAGACDAALRHATADDAILVAGSLYVVGAARTHLARVLP